MDGTLSNQKVGSDFIDFYLLENYYKTKEFLKKQAMKRNWNFLHFFILFHLI